METIRKIEVSCPMCENFNDIVIPENIFNRKKFGTIKIQVPQGGVCPDHHFIVIIDSKGIIRGYVKVDLRIETPTDATQFSLHGFIDIFGLYGLLSLIHAKIFNYLTFIFTDEDIKNQSEIINKLGESLLPEKYRGMNYITFLDESEYNQIRKDKNILIMDSYKNILQTPWKTKLKFEEEIVKKALSKSIEDEQIKIMQELISNFIKEVEFSTKILEKGEIYADELGKTISKELLLPKVNFYRVSLIKEFIERSVSSKLAQKIKNKVDEFLSFL